MRLIASICISIISASVLGAAVTNIDVVDGRPIVNEIYINGQGPFRFLMDSGAQSSQIELNLGLKLGLTPVSRIALASMGKTVLVPLCVAKQVRVGDSEAKDQELLMTDVKNLRLLDKRIDGVLGQTFLRQFDYSIDFRTKRLEFGASEMEGTRVETEWREGSMSMETDQGRMILDSGTDSLILFGERVGSRASIATAAGLMAAEAVDARSVKIGGRKYRPSATAYMPVEGAREAGLVPMSLFRRLFVCNSGGYLVLGGK